MRILNSFPNIRKFAKRSLLTLPILSAFWRPFPSPHPLRMSCLHLFLVHARTMPNAGGACLQHISQISVCPDAGCQAQNIRMRRVRQKTGRRNPYCWRCPRHWNRRVFERTGSILENSNLSWQDLVALLHFWSFNLPIKTTVWLTGICEHTVIEWHKASNNIPPVPQ